MGVHFSHGWVFAVEHACCCSWRSWLLAARHHPGSSARRCRLPPPKHTLQHAKHTRHAPNTCSRRPTRTRVLLLYVKKMSPLHGVGHISPVSPFASPFEFATCSPGIPLQAPKPKHRRKRALSAPSKPTSSPDSSAELPTEQLFSPPILFLRDPAQGPSNVGTDEVFLDATRPRSTSVKSVGSSSGQWHQIPVPDVQEVPLVASGLAQSHTQCTEGDVHRVGPHAALYMGGVGWALGRIKGFPTSDRGAKPAFLSLSMCLLFSFPSSSLLGCQESL